MGEEFNEGSGKSIKDVGISRVALCIWVRNSFIDWDGN